MTVPVSVTCIHKGPVEPLMHALKGVAAALVDEFEVIVVDTGSTRVQRRRLEKELQQYPHKLICEDLAVDYNPLIEKYLGADPELVDEFRTFQGNSKGILNFADARQIASDAATHPVQFWIDSDDELLEATPGLLRKMIDDVFGAEKPELDCVFLDYLYAFDEDGTCITTLRRERIFDARTYEWKGACHETAIPREGKTPLGVGYFHDLHAQIVHTDARKPHRISDIRNYVILANDAEVTSEDVDPRTIYYLANAARGLSFMAKASSLYKKFDSLSGSVDDRFGAAFYRGGMALDPRVKRPFEALEAYQECTTIKPFDPRGYFGIARTYLALERPKESLTNYRVGMQYDMPEDQVHSFDPTHIHYHPHIVAAYAAKELHLPEEAISCIQKAYKFRPDLPEAREYTQDIYNWAAGEKLTAGVQDILANLEFGGGPEYRRVGKRIVDELTACPEQLEERGLGKTEPPDARPARPDLVLFCPGMAEKWGPASREVGIGGSEKMVILLAEEIQSLGAVNVSVYANVPPEMRGVDPRTGVLWRHFSEIDVTRPRDTVVYWRSPEAVLTVAPPARQRILWLHDVTFPDKFPEGCLECFDYVQFQSEYHTTFLKDFVPPEKMWVARNALELPTVGPVTRDPKQIVYCSSWDRGLMSTCEIVRRAQKVDPEISLVVTYGISKWARKLYAGKNHRHIPDMGRDISTDVYETLLYSALDEVGATTLNRVNFKQMEALFRQSGAWLYPTRFPEISCMSAMEAQANGCIPLSTRFGALAETVLPIAGTLSPFLPDLPEGGSISEEVYDECARLLVAACSMDADDPRRLEVATQAIDSYRVDELARIWLDKLGLLGDSAATDGGQDLDSCPSAELSTSIEGRAFPE